MIPRPAAGVILAMLLASGLAAGAPPASTDDLPPIPGFKSYAIVTLDAERIRTDADAGRPVVLDFGEWDLALMLEYHDVRAPGFVSGWFDENNTFHRTYPERAGTYRGDVVGEDGVLRVADTEARVQVYGGVLRASVVTPETVHYLEPLADHVPDAAADAYLAYTPELMQPWGVVDTVLPASLPLAPVDAASPARTGSMASPGSTTRIVRLLAATDPAYVSDRGSQSAAASRVEYDVGLAEMLYQGQFTVDFQISATLHLTAAQAGNTLVDWKKRDAFRDHVNTNRNAFPSGTPDWNAGHLWSGDELCDGDADTACWTLGVASEGTYAQWDAYSLTQHEPTYHMNYFANDHQRKVTISHEVGHLFNGNHCHAHFREDLFADDVKTVMMVWNQLNDAEKNDPTCDYAEQLHIDENYIERFSDSATDGSGRDNRQRIQTVLNTVYAPVGTPPQPSGPWLAYQNEPVSISFYNPSVACYHVQIDWGDGTALTRPGDADKQCSSYAGQPFAVSHTYASTGTYEVRMRVKLSPYVYGQWSAWSTAWPVTIECRGDDPGPGCDAPNSFTEAPEVAANGDFSGYLLAGDAGDYYKFSVPSGSSISVTMSPPSCVNYDLDLYNPSGSRVAFGVNTGCASETVAASNAASGYWRVRVKPVSGSSSNYAYGVSVGVAAPNQGPSVDLASPASGSTLSGLVQVSGTASDPDNGVASVEYRIDLGPWQPAIGTTSWYFTWDTTTASNGQHTVRVRSFDGSLHSAEDSATYTVSNGGSGTRTIRDDDGTMDGTQLDLNANDDTAIKYLILPGDALTGATSAQLFVYAASGQCDTGSSPITLRVNGNSVTTLSPCNVWGTSAHEWRSLNVPVGNLAAGTTNSFELEDSSSYSTNNLYLPLDTSNVGVFDRTDAQDNNVAKSGELMWYLVIACSNCGGGGGGGFSDNVENGVNGWTSSGLWHIVTRRANSPTHSWWYGQDGTGNYDTGTANSGNLVSPSIAVPSGSPQLKFQSWYETEDTSASWDTKKVYVSTDGGSSWTQVHQVSGTNLAWTLQTVGLSAYAGQTIKVRFAFDTVDHQYNAFEGWFVDDIQVTGS